MTTANPDSNRPTWRRLAPAGVIGAVLVLAACGGGGSPWRAASAADGSGSGAANLRTISVTGSGVAEIQPDLAILSVTVHVDGDTAAAALDANGGKMGPVLAAARAAGVADADVQTRFVSASPRFDGNPPHPAGYTANHSITLRIHDLANAGAVVDAVVAAGGAGLSLDSFQLTEDDPGKGLDDARSKAIADARAKATAMAQASGVTLGPVRSVADASAGSGSANFLRFGAATSDAAAPASPSLPIAPGTDRQTVEVTVVYDLS
jgi:uncharacterized protein